LIAAREVLGTHVAAVAPDALVEFVKWNMLHDLGENCRSSVHFRGSLPVGGIGAVKIGDRS
jgi:RNA 3'-terminal phosphate cyclase